MASFNANNIHGNVLDKIEEALSYLRIYMACHDRNIMINRVYIDGELVRLNFSVDGKKYVLSIDNKIVLSRQNSKNVSEKHEITYDQFAFVTDIIKELFNG